MEPHRNFHRPRDRSPDSLEAHIFMQELNEVLDLYLPFVSSPNARKELINPRFHRLVMSKASSASTNAS